MNETGNNIDFCFVELAIDELGKIDADHIIILI